jgi:hypothetical protein
MGLGDLWCNAQSQHNYFSKTMAGDIFILRKATVQALKGCASLRQAMMHACVLVPKVSLPDISPPHSCTWKCKCYLLLKSLF